MSVFVNLRDNSNIRTKCQHDDDDDDGTTLSIWGRLQDCQNEGTTVNIRQHLTTLGHICQHEGITVNISVQLLTGGYTLTGRHSYPGQSSEEEGIIQHESEAVNTRSQLLICKYALISGFFLLTIINLPKNVISFKHCQNKNSRALRPLALFS